MFDGDNLPELVEWLEIPLVITQERRRGSCGCVDLELNLIAKTCLGIPLPDKLKTGNPSFVQRVRLNFWPMSPIYTYFLQLI